jgi:hypothetical protein
MGLLRTIKCVCVACRGQGEVAKKAQEGREKKKDPATLTSPHRRTRGLARAESGNGEQEVVKKMRKAEEEEEEEQQEEEGGGLMPQQYGHYVPALSSSAVVGERHWGAMGGSGCVERPVGRLADGTRLTFEACCRALVHLRNTHTLDQHKADAAR